VNVPAPAEIAAARHSLGIAPEAPVILVVSRLRWEKGLDVLVQALDRFSDIGTLHTIVIGVGPEETRLRQLAARCRVPVHFLGHRQDIGRWLGAADVIAMPSRRESFGRVTLEAMAAGRPLVASRVGGLTEAVVEGETGVLVPPDDAAALAAALRSVLVDPAGRSRMGRAARRRYQASYTIDHMATSWREAWERAVAGARPVS
jgi:glycosyltransferase involved in cell wall biosynthesis